MKGDRVETIIGGTNTLTVNRKTDIGYMLDSSIGEIFLHFNESNHENLKPGSKVEAFLYFDQKGRLAATLKKPYITILSPGFLKVVSVIDELGVFLDLGISKDILLSADDLPRSFDLWPEIGDMLYVTIKVKGKLVAKIASKEEIKLKPTNSLSLKDEVEAYILKIGKEGINLLSQEGHQIFVHRSMYKEQVRVGQKVNVKITYISDKGYTGSLIAQKEEAIYDDANKILSHLIRYGDLNLDANSSPEEIKEIFNMSKKAFKRAIGNLYKERKVLFKDGKTLLVK